MESSDEISVDLQNKVKLFEEYIINDKEALESFKSIIQDFRDHIIQLNTNYKELETKYEVTRQRLRVLGGVEKLQQFSRHNNNNNKPLITSNSNDIIENRSLLLKNEDNNSSWVSRRFRDLHPDSFSSSRLKRSASYSTSPNKGSSSSLPNSRKIDYSSDSNSIKIQNTQPTNTRIISKEDSHNIPPVSVNNDAPKDNNENITEDINSTNIDNIKGISENVIQIQSERMGIDVQESNEEESKSNTMQSRLELLISNLNAASENGLKQKLEIEKIRKLERMMILTPSKSTTTPQLKRKKSFNSSKKLLLTAPRNFKLVSQKSETEEMERLFLITKDYVDQPSHKIQEEEKILNQKTKDRIAVAKETLSFTVNLSECELNFIPESVVSNLKKSKVLDLSHNLFTNLNADIGKFDALEELILSYNSLSTIHPSIYKLVNLKVLIVSHNKLLNLPPEIGYLSELEVLDVSNNILSDLPKQIGHLEKLKSINIGHNQKLDNIPREIGYLTSLILFEAPYCSLSKIPKELCNLANLQFLDLSHNLIDELPLQIGLLTNLSLLNVSDNSLKTLPLTLGCCKALENGNIDVMNNSLDQKFGPSFDDGKAVFLKVVSLMNGTEEFLCKASDCQPPNRLKLIPKPMSKVDDVFTLQEKMLCLSNWCSKTIESYIKPSLLNLSQDVKNIDSLDSEVINSIEEKVIQIKVFTKRNEDSLPKIEKEIIEWKKQEGELAQLKSLLLNELLIIEKIIIGSESLLKKLAQQEMVNDIAQVVYIVHYIRELLFILVLKK